MDKLFSLYVVISSLKQMPQVCFVSSDKIVTGSKQNLRIQQLSLPVCCEISPSKKTGQFNHLTALAWFFLIKDSKRNNRNLCYSSCAL